jgi:hypothetical protein
MPYAPIAFTHSKKRKEPKELNVVSFIILKNIV